MQYAGVWMDERTVTQCSVLLNAGNALQNASGWPTRHRRRSGAMGCLRWRASGSDSHRVPSGSIRSQEKERLTSSPKSLSLIRTLQGTGYQLCHHGKADRLGKLTYAQPVHHTRAVYLDRPHA